jgi:hypothetical protein
VCSWFEDLTGFQEAGYETTRALKKVMMHELLTGRIRPV